MEIPDQILRRLTQIPGMRTLWSRLPFGSVQLRVRYGIFPRPDYAYGVCAAARLAKKLNLQAISVIEFGVAGGNGLLALESIAEEIEGETGLEISVFGFDTGSGMPAPEDYRDLPYVWGEGFYSMNQVKLTANLKRARLFLGDVEQTIPAFLQTPRLPPLAFIAFDLDYYSSTKKAFAVLQSPPVLRLPRVYCYFDDVIWPEFACHNENIGELCAIREFNLINENKKLCQIHMLAYQMPHAASWHEQMYVLHDFQHPLYCVNLMEKTEAATQMPLLHRAKRAAPTR